MKSLHQGFMGPVTSKPNPTYREVCSGMTGHVEVYDCEFDGEEKTYEKLVRHFFSFHDPTTMNQQGNDKGTQYASVIFCYDQKQTEIASRVKAELQELLTKRKVRNYQVIRDFTDWCD
jgi:peptide-methionine (S)-S-oxide reductase